MVIATTEKRKLQTVLGDEDAFATSLLTIVLDTYGTAVLEWEPDTLWMGIAEDFGVTLPAVNRDKIQALLLVLTTNQPLVSVEAFNYVCNVLSGTEANFRSWDPLSPEEALWGIYEMMLHIGIDRAPKEPPPEFSHEIRRYLGVILRDEGMFDPPDLLQIAEFDTANDIEQWADEPEMYNAFFDKSRTDRARLLEGLGHRLLALLREMNDLPLEFRNADWDKFKTGVERSATKLTTEHQRALAART